MKVVSDERTFAHPQLHATDSIIVLHTVSSSCRFDSCQQGAPDEPRPLERSYSDMVNLMKLEEQLSPASRGYPHGCGQDGDEDTTSVASDRSDETFDMAKGNLSLLEKAIALESERAKVMRDRMASEHAAPRRDHHGLRGHGELSPRLSSGAEERKSRMHHDGLKRAYYPKGRRPRPLTVQSEALISSHTQEPSSVRTDFTVTPAVSQCAERMIHSRKPVSFP